MIKLTSALFVLSAFSIYAQAPALQYQITPVLEAEKPHILVKVAYLPAFDSEKTQFYFANKHWGETDLWNCMEGLRANGALLPERDSNRFTVMHARNALVELEYTIRPDKFTPLSWDRSYRPIVESGAFHIFGFVLLAVPNDYWSDSKDWQPVEMTWEGPPDMALANSFFSGPPGSYVIEALRLHLDECVFTGGAITVRKLPTNGDTVYFAHRPFALLDLDTVSATLQLAVASQRDFWKETQKYYLVTLFPTSEVWNDSIKHLSVGGSGLHQSFSCMMSDNHAPNKEQRMTYLFFHEMMHHWIGNTIRTADEEKQYWFTEGFTDYFQTKLRLASGVLNPQQFIKEINQEVLAKYDASPVRNMPNDSITYYNFWNNRDYEKLPYQRGMLFALLLDNTLRLQGDKSLDDGMFRLLEVSRQYPDLRMNNERLLEHLHEGTGMDLDGLFERHIIQGKPIEWEKTPLPPGLTLRIEANARTFIYDEGLIEALHSFLTR